MPTILIVDDENRNRVLLVKLLGPRGYDTVEAVHGRDGLDTARRLVAERRLDVVLLDLNMPVLDGYGFLAEAAGDSALCDVPVILVTASRDDIVRGIDAGAHDYIVKPFEFAELTVRVRAAVRVKELQDRLKQQNAELEALSSTDALTGLANRRGTEAQLRRLASGARRDDQPLAVLLVDVDHFKRINDTAGHATGDAVLVELGRRVRDSIRVEDIAGRRGGEKFLLGLPFTDPAGATVLAERLRATVGATSVGGVGFRRGGSFGGYGGNGDYGGPYITPAPASLSTSTSTAQPGAV
jgi:diguanylate cyclase (GGDEF)-like protein